MKTRSISANAFQLTRFGLVNVYLVRESDGWTLIDTGVGGSAKGIAAAIASLGGGTLARILLTHAHGDHVGSVDALKALYPAAEVLISARDERLLRQPPVRSLDPGEPAGKIKGSLPGIATRPTRLLEDGDRIGSLVAIATPGHIPGHLSFFDGRDGTLYAGDALVTVGGKVHVSGFGPWFFPLPSLATWHKPTAMASAKRLQQEFGARVRTYAAGHGRLVTGGRILLR